MQASDSWQGKLAWTVTPPLVRLVGSVAWRLHIDTTSGFPEAPFVIASNHHSFLDPFLVGAAFRSKIRYLALTDLFGNHRWLDQALDAFDVIPVRRGAVPLGPIRASLDHLVAGGVVGVFPEGTRHDRFDPGRTRPGAAWLATRMNVPLVPAAITGTETVLGPDNRLHRGRVRLSIGPPLRAIGRDRTAIDDLNRRWGKWVAGAI